MHKSIATRIKATVKSLIVAFIYVLIILIGTRLILAKPIKSLEEIISLITVKSSKQILKDIKFDFEKKELTSYPKYGEQYATLKIPSVDIEQPIYYGDDLDILKYGVGHTVISYFPGEGGSILYMGHNTIGMLHTLPQITIGSTITVEAVYGNYNYKVTNTKIIKDTETNEVPIQKDKEILMIYTCYPVTALGYTPYRFVVYAEIQ